MDRFKKELETGEIHQRDRFQFELKSEFIPDPTIQKNTYKQEFYIFIPNSLQVNPETYSRSQFYRDQTNLIRYKTPEFSLKELYDGTNPKSPLTRLSKYKDSSPTSGNIRVVEDELKLLGNALRSSLRERVAKIIHYIEDDQEKTSLKEVTQACEELTLFRKHFHDVEADFLKQWTSILQQSHFLYLDEFLSDTINYYLIGLLDHLRRSSLKNRNDICEEVGRVLTDERRHREKTLKEQKISNDDSVSNEYILYRSSLLNKFILDALLLNTTRSSVATRFQNLIGSVAAGIAMLFFFVLFVHQSNVLIINSIPFILLTVILYILKDRIKEGLKTISYRQFAKWFSDYKTEIYSPDESMMVGKMREYFSFIEEDEVPEDIAKIRNREFHVVLETFKRPEQVMYYKKNISMVQSYLSRDIRRHALNIIFRYNINQFLIKADDPTHDYVTVDPNTLEFFRAKLPKVYHVNMILKNTYYNKETGWKTELKKFRLIVDKLGIKRVEHLIN